MSCLSAGCYLLTAANISRDADKPDLGVVQTVAGILKFMHFLESRLSHWLFSQSQTSRQRAAAASESCRASGRTPLDVLAILTVVVPNKLLS